MRIPIHELPQRLQAQVAAQLAPGPIQVPCRPVIARTSARNEPEMNGTERAFGAWLEEERRQGRIEGFKFEALTLRLAKKTSYTPDFMAWEPSGELRFYEVKGFWRDDARVKIKAAAAMFPFRFIAVQKQGKGWAFEEMPSA